jgi:hypothetical protein
VTPAPAPPPPATPTPATPTPATPEPTSAPPVAQATPTPPQKAAPSDSSDAGAGQDEEKKEDPGDAGAPLPLPTPYVVRPPDEGGEVVFAKTQEERVQQRAPLIEGGAFSQKIAEQGLEPAAGGDEENAYIRQEVETGQKAAVRGNPLAMMILHAIAGLRLYASPGGSAYALRFGDPVSAGIYANLTNDPAADILDWVNGPEPQSEIAQTAKDDIDQVMAAPLLFAGAGAADEEGSFFIEDEIVDEELLSGQRFTQAGPLEGEFDPFESSSANPDDSFDFDAWNEYDASEETGVATTPKIVQRFYGPKSLREMAREVSRSASSPKALRRVIAIGADENGALWAGSSNGFDAGQRAALERLGIKPVPGSRSLHAEQELVRAVDRGKIPRLISVGTYSRFPCPEICGPLLESRGIAVVGGSGYFPGLR